MLRVLFSLLQGAGQPRPDPQEPVQAEDDTRRGTSMLLTTRRFPIYYLPITKCGCTYLKNLFYFLDHDREHPKADRLHDEPADLMRAGHLPLRHVQDSRFAFVVLRNPVDRFLSLYFDKIWGDGPGSFPEIRRQMATELGLDLDRDIDAGRHRENCRRLIGWLDRNLAHQTDEPVNAHWRRQSSRLRRAADLNLTPLTLDGLDWQLPMLLEPAIPDLQARMQAVKARNAAPRPVRTADLATPDLVADIEQVYTRDAETVAAARSLWDTRRAAGWENCAPDRPRLSAAPGQPTLRLTTTHRHPVHFLPIPKCGCTFVRNLFYRIDHGRPHPDPLGIQADDCLLKVEVTAEGHQDRGFLVLRDPVARFFSFYFDKVIGTGPHAFPWIAQKLVERREFSLGPDLGIEDHRANCRRLLGFIEHQMETLGVTEVNAHWRPQTAFADRARPFGLRALLLEHLDDQLPRHLGALIPDLPALMADVSGRNAAPRPVPAQAILNGKLETRILALYGEDRVLWQRVQAEWEAGGSAPPV